MSERNDLAEARLRALVLRACRGNEEIADGLMKGIRDMVHMLAMVLAANPETAPNHITIDYEAGADHYELTIRKHGGVSPAAKIAALEDEVERLRERLAEETRR
jgi:hypothetical protein